MKQIRILFKSGANIIAPYSSKFYSELSEKMGTTATVEHPSAVIETNDIQAIVFENITETE